MYTSLSGNSRLSFLNQTMFTLSDGYAILNSNAVLCAMEKKKTGGGWGGGGRRACSRVNHVLGPEEAVPWFELGGWLFRFEQALPGRDNTTLNLLDSGHYHMLVPIRMDQGHHAPWVICTVSVAIHGDGVAFTYNLSMTFKVACVQGCECRVGP